MSQINTRLLNYGTPRHLGLCLLATAVCATLFAPLIQGFQASTGGLMPLDNQLLLSREDISQQLALYTQSTRHYYAAFALVDVAFPPLLSLCFALLWAWLLQRAASPTTLKLATSPLLLLPFASTLCDWAENIGNLLLIYSYPDFPAGLATWAIACKYTKLGCIGLNLLVSVALATIWRRPAHIDPDQNGDK